MKNGCLIWRHKKQHSEFFLPVKATSINFVWFIKTNDQVTHTGNNIISMYSVGLTGQHNQSAYFAILTSVKSFTWKITMEKSKDCYPYTS